MKIDFSQTEWVVKVVSAKTNDRLRAEVVQAAQPIVFYVVKKFCGRRDEDLIQEGNLALLQAIDHFNPEKAKFVTFTYSCVWNRLCRVVGKKAKRLIEVRLDGKNLKLRALTPDPVGQIHARELLDRRGMDLVLAKSEGWTNKEIAELVGVCTQTVKNHQTRAKKRALASL